LKILSDQSPESWNSYYAPTSASKRISGLVKILDGIFGPAPGYIPIGERDYVMPDINAHLLDVYDWLDLKTYLTQIKSPSMLELGCGPAKFSLKLGRMNSNLYCCMVDFSGAVGAEIEDTIRFEGLNAQFQVCNVLDFSDEIQYHIVYGGALLCHVGPHNLERAFQKFTDHCAEGGLVINAEPIPSLEMETLHQVPGIREASIKGTPICLEQLKRLHETNGLEVLYAGRACIFQRTHILGALPLRYLVRLMPHLILMIPLKCLALPYGYFLKRSEHNRWAACFSTILSPLYEAVSFLCRAVGRAVGSHAIMVGRKKGGILEDCISNRRLKGTGTEGID